MGCILEKPELADRDLLQMSLEPLDVVLVRMGQGKGREVSRTSGEQHLTSLTGVLD